MKKIVRMALSTVGLFVISIAFFLHLNGMLVASPPFLVATVQAPLDSEANADSSATSAVQVASDTDAAGAATVDAALPHEDTAPPAPQSGTATSAAARGDATGSPPSSGADSLAATARAPEGAVQQVAGAAPSTSEDDVSREDKLARLVRVYEQMRAKQVALILNTMPDDESAAILERMPERTAAKVMAGMSPEKAARMSRILVESDGHD